MNADIEEIDELIEIFKKAEKNEKIYYKVKQFNHAIDLSDEIVADFPEYKNKIENIRKANIRSVLLFLKNKRPDIEYTDLINLFLIFIVKCKKETKEIINQKPSLKNYLIEFISLYSTKRREELRTAISSLL